MTRTVITLRKPDGSAQLVGHGDEYASLAALWLRPAPEGARYEVRPLEEASLRGLPSEDAAALVRRQLAR